MVAGETAKMSAIVKLGKGNLRHRCWELNLASLRETILALFYCSVVSGSVGTCQRYQSVCPDPKSPNNTHGGNILESSLSVLSFSSISCCVRSCTISSKLAAFFSITFSTLSMISILESIKEVIYIMDLLCKRAYLFQIPILTD